MLKVDVDPIELVPLTIGDSDRFMWVNTVVAIGNPYGLSGTMTVGIVSARGRTLESIRQRQTALILAGDLIQTDATIPRHSGGPLLNLKAMCLDQPCDPNNGTTVSGTTTQYGHRFLRCLPYSQFGAASLVNGETYDSPYPGTLSPVFNEL